jgi:hypothetical protein
MSNNSMGNFNDQVPESSSASQFSGSTLVTQASKPILDAGKDAQQPAQAPDVTEIQPEGTVEGDSASRPGGINETEPATPIAAPGLEVVKVDKPQSRTAIGQVSQSLRTTPLLHVFELLMDNNSANDRQLIASRTLRRKAVEKWLETNMTEFGGSTTIDISPKAGVVRLIVILSQERLRTVLSGRVNLLKPET